jgi:ankyrin repeat protein
MSDALIHRVVHPQIKVIMTLETEILTILQSCLRGELNLHRTADAATVAAVGNPLSSTSSHLRDNQGNSLLDITIIHMLPNLIARLCVPSAGFLSTADDCSRALEYSVDTNNVAIVVQVARAIRTEYQRKDTTFSLEYHRIINSAFKIACYEGQIDVVRWFIEYSPRLEVPTRQINQNINPAHGGDTRLLDVDALLRAWCNGHIDVVKALITAGATSHLSSRENPNGFLQDVLDDSDDKEAHAYHGGNRDALLALLVTTGVSWCNDFDTWACVSSPQTMKLLLRMVDAENDRHAEEYIEEVFYYTVTTDFGEWRYANALLDIADRRKLTLDDSKLFDYALCCDDREIAERLFTRQTVLGQMDTRSAVIHGENQDIENRDWWDEYTPMSKSMVLMYAVACNSLVIVATLLHDKETDVNAVFNNFRFEKTPEYTSLSRASDPHIIKLLLQAKAEVNPPDCVTVLEGACRHSRLDALQMLLAAGADVNMLGNGESAMYSAAHYFSRFDDSVAIISRLYDAGASACHGKDGRSVLHRANHGSRIGQVEVSYILSREPAIIWYRDNDGATALMRAYYNRDNFLITALLEAGADARARDTRGATAFFYLFSTPVWNTCISVPVSLHYKNTTFQHLLSTGADPTVCRYNGETLIMQVLPPVPVQWPERDQTPSDDASNALLNIIINAVMTLPVVAAQRPQTQGKDVQVDEEKRSDSVIRRPRKRVKR